jgi:hypothetical protein
VLRSKTASITKLTRPPFKSFWNFLALLVLIG